MFFQGILAYVSSPVWALFVILSLVAPYFAPSPDYFPQPYQLFPVFPDDQTSKAITLLVGIFGLLILPKLLILAQAILSGRAGGFGGAARSGLSVLCELVTSSLLAPVFMLFQSRSVIQVLTGSDGGWPATRRGAQALEMGEAWAASRWMVLIGAGTLLATGYFVPAMLVWLIPIAVPMLFAPMLIWFTARPFAGPVYQTPQESDPAMILVDRQAILDRWTQTQAIPARAEAGPTGALTHA